MSEIRFVLRKAVPGMGGKALSWFGNKAKGFTLDAIRRDADDSLRGSIAARSSRNDGDREGRT